MAFPQAPPRWKICSYSKTLHSVNLGALCHAMNANCNVKFIDKFFLQAQSHQSGAGWLSVPSASALIWSLWNYLHTFVEELHLIDNQSQVIGFSMGTVVTSKAAKRTQELGLPILARWKTKFMSGPFLYTLCFLDMLGYLLTLPIVYDMVIVFKINIVRHDNCMIIIWQLHDNYMIIAFHIHNIARLTLLDPCPADEAMVGNFLYF